MHAVNAVWARAVALPVALALATAPVGCGALHDDAPTLPNKPLCKTIDERLGPLMQLTAAGKTQHIAALLASRLDLQSQRALVQLLLDVAKALPPGAAQLMPDLLSTSGLGALVPVVVALLAPLPGNAQVQPPIPPRTAEMQAISQVAAACLTDQLFILGSRLFRDPRTADAITTLLAQGPQGVQAALAALQTTGPQGRKAFQALVRNFATALAVPDFAPEPLLDTVDRLVDPAQPGALGALRDLLRIAVLGESAADRAQAIVALQGFSSCFLRLDTDQHIAGHLFDVAVGLDAQTMATATQLDGRKWLPLLAYATDVLATQPEARDAWDQLLGLLLRPDVAESVLPELIAVLQSDALAGGLSLLGDLLAQPCKVPQ